VSEFVIGCMQATMRLTSTVQRIQIIINKIMNHKTAHTHTRTRAPHLRLSSTASGSASSGYLLSRSQYTYTYPLDEPQHVPASFQLRSFLGRCRAQGRSTRPPYASRSMKPSLGRGWRCEGFCGAAVFTCTGVHRQQVRLEWTPLDALAHPVQQVALCYKKIRRPMQGVRRVGHSSARPHRYMQKDAR
jgi:hypothetical protein